MSNNRKSKKDWGGNYNEPKYLKPKPKKIDVAKDSNADTRYTTAGWDTNTSGVADCSEYFAIYNKYIKMWMDKQYYYKIVTIYKDRYIYSRDGKLYTNSADKTPPTTNEIRKLHTFIDDTAEVFEL